MTQLPMLVTPGFEAWKTKEAKVGEDVPAEWGDWLERAINWENIDRHDAAGVRRGHPGLRHPESVRRVKQAIDELMAVPELA